MRKRAILFLLLMNCFLAKSQFDAQISQYMFADEAYNPARVSENNKYNLLGLHRQQWIGIDNAPQTTFFIANAPLSFLKHDHGVGLMFSNDNAGLFSTQSVYLQYTFKYKIKQGILSFGLNLGFINQTINGDSVHLVSSDYHTETDPSIPTTSINAMTADIGLGIAYKTKKLYCGISLLHLADPKIDLDDYIETYIGKTLYLTGGYIFALPNNRYSITGSTLIKSDLVSYQVDLNAKLEKDGKYYGGIGWRFQDALIFFGGINLNMGLSIGYSFDLATSKIISNSYGSHELYLRYSFLFANKKKNKYKSVRIL